MSTLARRDPGSLPLHLPWLGERAWSPYVAGILIGLLQIPAFLLADTALGASSSYVLVAGHIAALFDPAAAEAGTYFSKYMSATKYAWQTAMVVGIALGAYLSMRLSGATRNAFSPAWTRAVGIRGFGPRAAMAFSGGFVMLFGARLAGGCPSGHGLSGMAQLAVSSTVAIAFAFAGGIAVAALMRKL